MHGRFAVVAALLFGAGVTSRAQQMSSSQGQSVQILATSSSPDSLLLSDVRIVQIVSGGSWVQGEHTGHYRVIVLRDSTRLAHHTTYLQWLERQGLTERVELVYSVDLHSLAPQWYQILAPEVRMTKTGTWILNVEAASRPLVPTSRRLSFSLGPPGVIYLR